MSQYMPKDKQVPEVLIAGAGVAGLTLAILLEQLNIPYHIYERASEVKPLGSALSFGGHILPALEQLGLYEELLKASKSYQEIFFLDANCKKMGSYNVREFKKITGYDILIFARPQLYNILHKRVPAHKISYKKKITRTEEKDGKVYIYCSDDTSYSGDILIGADGAYSSVRQNIYKELEEKNTLPKSDKDGFSIGYTTIVGVANADPEKYPQLKEKNSNFNQILYKGGANAYVMTLANNQISWGLGLQLSNDTLRETHVNNAEWGPGSSDIHLKEYRDLPCPLGGTMGEIFDATPKELISKVLLEEKMFKTWYNGRSVLLGDACHKFHPAGGQGAANAIKDTIVLANCFYNMPDASAASITAAFKDFYKQRYKDAGLAYNGSNQFSKVLNGQRWTERLMRYAFLNLIPEWALKASLIKAYSFGAQIEWLPYITGRGKSPVPKKKKNQNITNQSTDSKAVAL
ncbi:hypothetical protein BGZ76_007605 [Entomortierella beljakovae]|nr:hypothetical protein BGZ76_007605 [Entomortierella beljakovae]